MSMKANDMDAAPEPLACLVSPSILKGHFSLLLSNVWLCSIRLRTIAQHGLLQV